MQFRSTTETGTEVDPLQLFFTVYEQNLAKKRRRRQRFLDEMEIRSRFSWKHP
jgi:hypothetical protein